ncbi:MAG: Wzz/FepE/Etk N-terminal domain-containing protein, partial [bacterium]
MTSPPKNFTEHVTLWFRWRWFIIGVVFAAALLTLVISFILPKTYRSTAIVLPPFEGGVALPFLEGISVDIFGANEVPTTVLVTLLKSRALKDKIHEQINLIEHYKQDDLENAYDIFEEHIEVELESEENFGAVNIIALKIHFLDRDPKFCARMVNLLVDRWNDLCVDINRRGASLRRQYVEESLLKTNDELVVYEDSLRVFQERYGIFSMNAQVDGTIMQLADLEQKIAEARITVEVLQKLFGANHPDLQRAKLELQGLQVEQRKRSSALSESEILRFPLNATPEISLEFYRRYRYVRMLEAVQQVLIQQYEQSKMQEIK